MFGSILVRQPELLLQEMWHCDVSEKAVFLAHYGKNVDNAYLVRRTFVDELFVLLANAVIN